MFDLTITNITDAARTAANEGSNALANASPTARHLLSSNTTNITVANPVPDLQWEASIEDSYFLDGNEIFSGDVFGIGVKQVNGELLPSWLHLDAGIGNVDTPGIAKAVVVQGCLAFLADGSSGLHVVDVSNSALPVILGSVDTPDSASDVAIQEDRVFVADSNSGLHVVDVSNTSAPMILGSVDTPGAAWGVAVQGNLAFVADSNAGLLLVDVSNSSAPMIISSVDTPSIVLSVVVQGELAFVSDRDFGLYVVDVNNSSAPVILGSVDTPTQTNSLAVQDRLAFVADLNAGLLVVDVSNLTNPVIIGSVDTPGHATSVAVQGDLVFVVDGAGLQVVDVRNPTLPVIITSVDTPGDADGVAVQNDQVLVADSVAGLQIIKLSEGYLLGSATLVLVGEQETLSVVAFAYDGVIQAMDTFVLTVNQLPMPADRSLPDQSLFPGQSLTLVLDSNTLFSDPDGSLLRLSISSSMGESPAWLVKRLAVAYRGGIDTPNYTVGVAVQSGLAYVVDRNLGLKIVDVSDPALFMIVGNVDTPGFAVSVAVQGDWVFVADYPSSLQVVDISNPALPVIVGSIDTPGDANDVAVQDDLVFVADGNSGLQVVDVSNPSLPVILGSVDTPSSALSVAIQGDLVFVVDRDSGLQVVDVSNSSEPTILGSVVTPGNALAVAVQGDLVFLAADLSGLQIVDISNPSLPIILGSVATPGNALGIAVQSDLVFVANYNIGLHIVDVSHASAPVIVGSVDTPGHARGFVVQGSQVFVADDHAGLSIYDASQWELTATPSEADVGNYEIVVTATDELGASVSDSFELRVEGPPIFNGTLTNQTISVGDVLNYFIPQGIVFDPNFDLVEFDATLLGGGELPAWLGFNAFSATFVGTPNVAGVYVIEVSATDNIAGTAKTAFELRVSYKPQVNDPIVDPNPWREGKTFSYTIPSNAFINLNGNGLDYSATLENSDPLPAWLSFDASTRTFSGEPPFNAESTLIVIVRATDPTTSLSVTQTFVLQVSPNLSPELLNPINDQRAQAGQAFVFGMPGNTFYDPNNDALNYTAAGLPDWLQFFNNNRTFMGRPSLFDTGLIFSEQHHRINITARDDAFEITTSFDVAVGGYSPLDLLVLIGSPTLTAFILGLTAYCNRAVVINRCHRLRYEKLEHTLHVGEHGQVIELDCDPEQIQTLQAKPERDENCLKKTCCFFKSSRRKNPNGELPNWLEYHPGANTIEVIAPGPSDEDDSFFRLQAKNASGILLFQQDFRVRAGQVNRHDRTDTTDDGLDPEGGVAMRAMS